MTPVNRARACGTSGNRPGRRLARAVRPWCRRMRGAILAGCRARARGRPTAGSSAKASSSVCGAPAACSPKTRRDC
ncbi:hypothetical protein FM106_02620 [Brachybacterium faecium]|nr:hypothetical protein FM106_02620 [Brachybacterium faecium]